MLKKDIAEPSFSSWASPSLLVSKSDGSFRFCTDYRKVNAITKPDSFPLPRIEDCIDQVGNAKFVNKFDLLKGYWQVPLTERAQEISAFIVPSGLFSYKVMSFLKMSFHPCVSGCGRYLAPVMVTIAASRVWAFGALEMF